MKNKMTIKMDWCKSKGEYYSNRNSYMIVVLGTTTIGLEMRPHVLAHNYTTVIKNCTKQYNWCKSLFH